MNKIKFLQCLADCKDPFTNEQCSGDIILHNPKVIEMLNDLIAELRPLKQTKPVKKLTVEKFVYDEKLSSKIFVDEHDLSIQYFSQNIAQVVSLGYTTLEKIIQNYLIDIGDLDLIKDPDKPDERKKIATRLGEQHGIVNNEKVSSLGKHYTLVQYTAEGQRYVISLLPKIFEFAKKQAAAV